MRKHLKTLLAICLILSLVCQIQPSTAVAYDDSFNVSGYTMSEDYFKTVYGSNPADKKENLETKDSETKTSADVRISNVEVKDNAIYLSLNMGTGGKNIMIGGEMYASARTQNGVNCIVVDAKCSNTAYDVLSFEIWNDSDTDRQILYNVALKNSPHVKLYLQSSAGAISLYEFPLPVSLSNLDASHYKKADNAIDLLWPLKIVDATVTEKTTDDAILEELGLLNDLRAPNTWTLWTDSRTYFYTFYIASTEYTSISLPCVEYRYTNVTGQDGTWTAGFKVSEHLTVTASDGTVTTYHGSNSFRYRNVKLVFACGDNTTFIRSYQDGRLHDPTAWNEYDYLKETGESIIINALKYTVSQIPGAVTYIEILEVLNELNEMTPDSHTVSLNDDGVSLNNKLTIAVGEKLEERYYLMECTDQGAEANKGDYFTFQAVTQYENAGGNTNTVGVLSIEFDVCLDNEEGYPKHRSRNIQFNYTASAS